MNRRRRSRVLQLPVGMFYFDRAVKWAGILAVIASCSFARGAETEAVASFKQSVEPLLTKYCYDCHADGMDKGGIAFDELKSDQDILDHNLWARVLKNVRADLMPPAKKARPNAGERKQLDDWIKYQAFGINPKNMDPGRVTVRRLNRVEYRNTIRDLMGIDFNTEVEFPPDDTGYGFDNIGDVLTVSPMLLEKYLDAAKSIVAEAVPVVSRSMPDRVIAGSQFRAVDANVVSVVRGQGNNRRGMLILPFDQSTNVTGSFRLEHPGSYQLAVELGVKGDFTFDAAKCRVTFKADDRELLRNEFGWQNNKTFRYEFNQQWEPGQHSLSFDLQPTASSNQETNLLQMRIVSVTVRGPMEKDYWTRTPNYDRFFPREVPAAPDDRRKYAHEVLGNFAKKAYRRPVDVQTVDRLAALAETIYSQPGKTFETGISYAMAAVLASPRFLFRLEETEQNTPDGARFANVDEYSLASRLSYFLWSTMPDEELFRLAERGELRKNLPAQIKRMLNDSRSEALVENFTGQWLQTRDVDGIAINARQVLARDNGTERLDRERRAAFLAQRQAEQNARSTQSNATNPPVAVALLTNALAQTNAVGRTNQFARGNRGRGRLFGPPPVELDGDLRAAMKRETQMAFHAVVHEDRSVTELIDCDYTFLNEKLARFYGITNVNGAEMRRVTLLPDNPRGGVLTDGSVLVVTSNPDRTSPVKRGLFILENILGTPAPPPPANVPALEAAEKDIKDHEPTLRESLQVHRDQPLCASCHQRMDPLGLAFENFNALGMWREKERNQPIDAAGKLITGESFNTVRELKSILTHERRNDFYRCLTEKLLTYALGRGLDYYDAETVDQIVQRLDQGNGRFLPLLTGIIESAPFQKRRIQANTFSAEATEPARRDTEMIQFTENRRQL